MKAKRVIEIYQEEGLKVLAKKGVNKVLSWQMFNQVSYKASMKKLQTRKRKETNLEDILDTAFSYQGYGIYRSIKPAQVRLELKCLAELVHENNPRTVLEIGSANGGTLYVWARYLDSVFTLISLDLPGGAFGGGYCKNHLPFFENFADEKEIKLIRKDSHDPNTKEEVKKILAGEKIDFLFIDGDHTYEGVKQDYEMYEPLVSDEGIIAFHDIVPGPSHKVGGVPEFWREIKKNDFVTQEIVKDWNQGGYGIGMILKMPV